METEDWVLVVGLFAFLGYLGFLAFLRSQPTNYVSLPQSTLIRVPRSMVEE